MIHFIAGCRRSGDYRAREQYIAAAYGASVLAFIVGFSYLLTLSPLHAQGGFSTLPYCAQYSDGTSLDRSFRLCRSAMRRSPAWAASVSTIRPRLGRHRPPIRGARSGRPMPLRRRRCRHRRCRPRPNSRKVPWTYQAHPLNRRTLRRRQIQHRNRPATRFTAARIVRPRRATRLLPSAAFPAILWVLRNRRRRSEE